MYKDVDRKSAVPESLPHVPAALDLASKRPTAARAWTDYFWNNYINDPKAAEKPDRPDKATHTSWALPTAPPTPSCWSHGNIDISQYKSAADVKMSSNIFGGGTTTHSRRQERRGQPRGRHPCSRDSKNAPDLGSWGGPFQEGRTDRHA